MTDVTGVLISRLTTHAFIACQKHRKRNGRMQMDISATTKTRAPHQTNAFKASVNLVQTSASPRPALITPIAMGGCARFGRLTDKNTVVPPVSALQAVHLTRYVRNFRALARLAIVSQRSTPMAHRLVHRAPTKTPARATCASVALAHTSVQTTLCVV